MCERIQYSTAKETIGLVGNLAAQEPCVAGINGHDRRLYGIQLQLQLQLQLHPIPEIRYGRHMSRHGYVEPRLIRQDSQPNMRKARRTRHLVEHHYWQPPHGTARDSTDNNVDCGCCALELLPCSFANSSDSLHSSRRNIESSQGA